METSTDGAACLGERDVRSSLLHLAGLQQPDHRLLLARRGGQRARHLEDHPLRQSRHQGRPELLVIRVL